MKFDETVLKVDGVVQLLFKIIIVKDGLRSVLDEIDLKKSRHQQEQPKEKINTHASNTQTQAQGENTEHSQSASLIPKKHDSKKRVTPQ